MSKIGFGFPPETAYFSPYDGSLGVAPTAAQGSSLVWLDTKTASASSTLDFTTGLSSTYKNYVFYMNRIVPSTAAGVWIRISEDGGATWKSGATVYGYAIHGYNSAGTLLVQSSGAGDSKIILQSSSGGATSIRGTVELETVDGSSNRYFRCQNLYVDGGTSLQATTIGGGNYNGSTNPINGVQFLLSTGNFTSGTIDLFGIKTP